VLWHGSALDRALARDLGSGEDSELALRAQQLSGEKRRRRLARGVRRAVGDADEPGRRAVSSTVPLAFGEIRRWREALLGIADRLERGGSINPRGVARVAILLSDGASPLYDRRAERSLSSWVWWIADGLQPCPPHEWTCPVLMKLDPDHVAWTCRRCGAVALSDDYSHKPAGSP
jgi:hypothetical protein